MTLMRSPVAYAAPTELDLNSWDAIAINMTLLTELLVGFPRSPERSCVVLDQPQRVEARPV
jgi:hypothetical protein